MTWRLYTQPDFLYMESLFGEVHLSITCWRCGRATLFYFCTEEGRREVFCLDCDEDAIDRLFDQ